MEKAKVYFTKEISSEAVLKMYKVLNKELPGKVAVKVHSGEAGNKNFLKPEFFVPVVEYVKGTVVECNTAYGGARNTTAKHKKLINDHKWDSYFDVDILDAEEDLRLEIPNGKVIKYNLVGKNIENYDSMLVLVHFKGHAMGGYGGALKQLSIGVGSTAGKALQHSAGRTEKQEECWSPDKIAGVIEFKEAMADAALSVVDYFKGEIAYVACMANISVDCDCDGNAAPPCMKDIGILSSLDPVALDRACNDLIINSDDPGKTQLLERINKLSGYRTIEAAEELGIGTTDYELINVD
ncbi:MAG: DUF362 domain-containing protein [Erysipelotrichaceae bacterium]|nr:DUF362 domain-containing protein [Erysipelotrichaceae bacterium]